MQIDAMDVGSNVSHYRIVRQLGGGGMGVLYQAEDLRLERTVALKFLSPLLLKDRQARERFKIEARAIAALEHSAICGIHDIEETADGYMFICMPFYEGETLAERLEHGPLPVRDALDMLTQVADGLAVAHEHGITHRDIKPSNIMLCGGEAKILDFGLAKLRGSTTVTMDGQMLGTFSYMSPEQARGDPDVDGRSDIFSLGVVMYECLTGRPPFQSDHMEAVIDQIKNVDPPPLRRYVPRIRDELQHIVDTALQKDPSRRYQTMQEFRADLAAFSAGLKIDTRRGRMRMFTLTACVAAVAVAGIVPASRHGIEGMVRHWMPESNTHVAILPFENVGKDPLNQPFCDGLLETLASQLSQLQAHRPSLSVIPPIALREREVTTPIEARKVLGVTNVFTGSVQRLGDHLRVTLSLIDVSRGAVPHQTKSVTIDTPVWREQDLQDQAVERMAQMLDMRLQPDEKSAVTAGHTTAPDAYAFYVQGMGYLSHYESGDNLERAIDTLSMAVEHDSLYALAYAGLGEAYWRKYRDTSDPQWIQRALTNAQRAQALDDNLARPHVILGQIQTGTSHEALAIPEFERAIALDPTNADAYSGLAAAYTQLKRYDDAEATFRRAIAVRPNYWGGYHELGMYYYKRGEYEKAITQFNDVARLTPDNKYAYNNLGGMYLLLARYDKAREMFQRSIEVGPNYRAYSNLGALDYMEGKYDDSARMCERAVSMNDRSYMSWANLGNAYYWVTGKKPEAMDAFRRAATLAESQRRLTPSDAPLLGSLAGYYAVLGQPDTAQTLIDESVRLAPTNGKVLYFAGHAYEQMGQRDHALERIGDALANHYPPSIVEDDPFMSELRKDARYQQMLARAPARN